MATARREGLPEGAVRPLPPPPRIPMTDLSEVDKIIHGSRFWNFPEPALPKVISSNPTAPAIPTPKDNVDHFSRMPVEILGFIISLLTMRQATATSVLSTRWRNLWTTSLSSLNLDIPNMLGHYYPEDIFEIEPQDYVTLERLKFTKWVYTVTMQLFYRESRFDALRISSILNKDYAPDIDKWIMTSVAHGVTEIHLDFDYAKYYGGLHNPYEEYEFPAQLVASTVRYLYLNFCNLHLPPDFTGFTSLVSLSLFHSTVTQSLVEDIILSKCPLLEFLSLKNCNYPHGTSFNFTGTSLRLKHLHIRVARNVTSIKLHNINLLSFELGKSGAKLSIQNAPHLARLVLLMLYPVDVISNTPRLQTLLLSESFEKTCIVPQTYVLNNLKRLVLFALLGKADLLGVIHVLKPCHSLQKLELDMGLNARIIRRRTHPTEVAKKLTVLPGTPLENLKEIEISGFEAYREKIAFAKYLLKNAVVLQKMKIYTASKAYCGNGRWKTFEGWEHYNNPRKQAIALEEVLKRLKKVAHPSTKVELFSSLQL